MGFMSQTPKKIMRQISSGFLILFLLTPYALIHYGGVHLLIPVAVVLVLGYYFILNILVKRAVGMYEPQGKIYLRTKPYVDIWTYLLLVLLFMMNAFLFEEDFKWLFICVSILVVIHILINYYIDSKYALQKLVITEEGIWSIEDVEHSYNWDWLRDNAELNGDTLKLSGLSRPNIKLDQFEDSEKAIVQIKKRLS